MNYRSSIYESEYRIIGTDARYALPHAIPGIILQLVLIPIFMLALEKSGVLRNADN